MNLRAVWCGDLDAETVLFKSHKALKTALAEVLMLKHAIQCRDEAKELGRASRA